MLFYYLFLFVFIQVSAARKSRQGKSDNFVPGFIIKLHKNATHEAFYDVLANILGTSKDKLSSFVNIKYEYKNVYHGLYISPNDRLSLNFFRSNLFNEFVSRVEYDKRVYAMEYSWGLDRIDQPYLPLDKAIYNPPYTGLGVDVYVLDSGLDTLHIEFIGNPKRIVKNIFDAYVTDQSNIAANNDVNGHGTHCAGTVGGNTVGVAPDANIYGLKVLGDDGSGLTCDILAGIEFIVDRSNGRPSVLSMSLGGPCYEDCAMDHEIIAVEDAISKGLFAAIAAGNSNCNACQTSPAAAKSAITVGASDQNDTKASFSNFGSCIDIFAPGKDIVSALTSKKSGKNNAYETISGTSQATPHVAGVIAQQLQKLSNDFTPQGLSKLLSCESSKNNLQLDILDTISRNYILQIPTYDDKFSTCDLTSNCSSLNFCSGHGVCQVQYPVSIFGYEYNRTGIDSCLCDKSYFGPDCSSTDSTISSCSNGIGSFSVALATDIIISAPFWGLSAFAIYNRTTGLMYNKLYDSLCGSSPHEFNYCLSPGEYSIDITRGSSPEYNEWFLANCSLFGGSPSTIEFDIEKNGNCKHICSNGLLLPLTVSNTKGDVGFNGGYYTIISLKNNKVIYGGTLLTMDGIEQTHEICLYKGTYKVSFEKVGTYPLQLSLEICGHYIYSFDVIEIEIDANLKCNILLSYPTYSPTTLISSSPIIVSSYQPTGANTVAISVIQSIDQCSYSAYNEDSLSADDCLKSVIQKCFSSNVYTSNIIDFRVLHNPNQLNGFNISYSISINDNLGINAQSLQNQLSDCITTGLFSSNLNSYSLFDGPESLATAKSSHATITIIKSQAVSDSSNQSDSKKKKLPAAAVAFIVLIPICSLLLFCYFFGYNYLGHMKFKAKGTSAISSSGGKSSSLETKEILQQRLL